MPKASHLACPVDQRRQRAELGAIMCLPPFMAVAHQSGLLQNSEMFRDNRLRDPGPSRQSPDRLLSFAAQPFEKSPPGRIGERSEEHVLGVRHLQSIPRWLWIYV
ncbi:hypothetical protein CUJ84_Chr002578 [Rhizobium leguminosarum]|uniref:Uncharacterized protein n=1 Tax=Rhizobium leguminosarum TaxID=384 RepID=A0A2K9Z3X6_RHILE|nr:hypothetical protein CUJ84_Chr002578 [Rhizobium leguminosarum]